jgi:hypothetical protein
VGSRATKGIDIEEEGPGSRRRRRVVLYNRGFCF